jgi:hypothetical protein
MVGRSPETGSDSCGPTRRPRRWWFWLGVGALLFLTIAVVYVVGWSGLLFPKVEPPLTGELTVVIRPPDSQDMLLVGEPAAVPVRAGGSMTLQVNFNKPMYSYIVWLDSQGQVVPLYPWNNDRVEVADADQPPPVRMPAKVVISPSLAGGGWSFGRRGGLETVLLLARPIPLGQDAQLGSLLGTLPPTKMRQRDELAAFGLDRGRDAVSSLLARSRGTEEEAREVDQPLLERLDRLRDQFELIRVVRFAHEGE